jgi:hypothetical protein
VEGLVEQHRNRGAGVQVGGDEVDRAVGRGEALDAMRRRLAFLFGPPDLPFLDKIGVADYLRAALALDDSSGQLQPQTT